MSVRACVSEAVSSLVTRALPYGSGRSLPLRDPDPDPGLFGPRSVTWRVMREPLLILAGGRALLMQAANPLVAQGAIDHSAYAVDPFGRLERTVDWVVISCFGTTREATRASAAVTALHGRVSGTLPRRHATRSHPAGTAYSASDPALLRWVHASFVDTMLAGHDALVGTLRPAERDRFVREWDAVGRLMGVPDELLWEDHAALRDYIDGEIASGRAAPGVGSRRVAATVLDPPLPSAGSRPWWALTRFVTVGLLPAPVRDGYRIPWSRLHDDTHRTLCSTIRAARPLLPPRLRVSPVHQAALARTRRRSQRRAA